VEAQKAAERGSEEKNAEGEESSEEKNHLHPTRGLIYLWEVQLRRGTATMEISAAFLAR
jgi:hypothetical protein